MYSIIIFLLGVDLLLLTLISHKVSRMRRELRDSSQYLMHVTHFNSVALRYTLNSLRPYIMALLNNAVDREDYKEAQMCKDMIAKMDKIIESEI